MSYILMTFDRVLRIQLVVPTCCRQGQLIRLSLTGASCVASRLAVGKDDYGGNIIQVPRLNFSFFIHSSTPTLFLLPICCSSRLSLFPSRALPYKSYHERSCQRFVSHRCRCRGRGRGRGRGCLIIW
jgi:hypothetical protein